jgi:chromosome segregation ATPase
MKNLFGENHGLDEKSIDFISKAIEKANLPGFDYLEFRMAVANLRGMDLDEATAFKSAFATARTMGLTKEKLLETATHYKNVVQKEKEQFDAASAKQQDIKVGANLQQVSELQKEINDNELKIKQLQAEIDTAKGKIRSLDFERDGAAAKIEEAKTKYLFTHQSIFNQMEQDMANIQKYL